MIVETQNLNQIVIGICNSMLGLELTPLAPEFDTARQLVASVEIRGDRQVLIEVFAHDQLMASIAEAMFDANESNLSPAEIKDAFGEIANMIGGNVKGSFVGATNISLPKIGLSHRSSDRFANGSQRTTFECCGYPLTIAVREVEKPPVPTAILNYAKMNETPVIPSNQSTFG